MKTTILVLGLTLVGCSNRLAWMDKPVSTWTPPHDMVYAIGATDGDAPQPVDRAYAISHQMRIVNYNDNGRDCFGISYNYTHEDTLEHNRKARLFQDHYPEINADFMFWK